MKTVTLKIADGIIEKFLSLLKRFPGNEIQIWEEPDYSIIDEESLFDIAAEPFIGMWIDNREMEDSSAWVRNIRQNDWAAFND